MNGIINPISFTIGRMNPPHYGHVDLLQNMIRKTLFLGGDKIVIFLSTIIDNTINILTLDEKKYILYEIFNNLKKKNKNFNNIKLFTFSEEYLNLNKLFLLGYSNSYNLFIGEDRKNTFTSLVDNFNINNKLSQIKINVLSRDNSSISSTYIRKIIKENKFNEFIQIINKSDIDKNIAYYIYFKFLLTYKFEESTKIYKKFIVIFIILILAILFSYFI